MLRQQLETDEGKRKESQMKMKRFAMLAVAVAAAVGLPVVCWSQVNSGSDGSDGAFNPTMSTNIDMTSRSSGVYQYTSVNIPYGVMVAFTPNANNTPVVWLVLSNCVINGSVNVSGLPGTSDGGGVGGPGGYRGGGGGGGAP
jgi:uncharacterized membrane protein YgcG